MRLRSLLLASTLLVGFASASQADGFVGIGWRQDNNAITNVTSNVAGPFEVFTVDSLATGNGPGAHFIIDVANASTQVDFPAPGLLFSNVTVSSTLFSTPVPHTLDVFITAFDLTGPISSIASGFTENYAVGGFTASLATLFSATNALFSGTPLADVSFTGMLPNSAGIVSPVASLGNPYSVTAVYHFANIADVRGGAQASISMIDGASVGPTAAVPGPMVGAGLPGLLSLLLLGECWRRRRYSQNSR